MPQLKKLYKYTKNTQHYIHQTVWNDYYDYYVIQMSWAFRSNVFVYRASFSEGFNGLWNSQVKTFLDPEIIATTQLFGIIWYHTYTTRAHYILENVYKKIWKCPYQNSQRKLMLVTFHPTCIIWLKQMKITKALTTDDRIRSVQELVIVYRHK